MTLHQLFAEATAQYPVEEHGLHWRVPGLTKRHTTKASALAAAARQKVEFVILRRLVNCEPRYAREVEYAIALAERHTANGGDWRDCARAALRELEGRTTRSDRRA
jgi:hypothetical protein